MKKYKKTFGQMLEKNIKDSLILAGVPVESSPDLDHNHKIDFIVKIGMQFVGIQTSLKKDRIKAKSAKICALDRVARFIYLNLSDDFFHQANKHYGIQLYYLLCYIIHRYNKKAIWITIDMKGWRVQEI
jgi:hypothetical protein